MKQRNTWCLRALRYIHANYRFIVDPREDYRAQATDADVHLEWGSVLQILVSAQSQSANCPICLSKPVAPRMAKCGHIFCLPCLIRYMHSNDDTNPVPEKKARWRKCPICWDTVYLSDTRPVRWFSGQEGEPPREGGDVVLRLIVRQPGSTLALPRDGAESLDRPDDIPWYFAAEVMDYARVMRGSEEYMSAQYDEEVEELRHQEKEDELIFGEDTIWTKKAVSGILEAKDKLRGMGNPPVAPRQPNEKAKRKTINFREDTENVPDFYITQHAAKSGQSSSRHSGPSEAPQVFSNANDVETVIRSSQNDTIKMNGSTVNSRRHDPKPTSYRLRASSSQSRGLSNNSSHLHGDSPFYFYEALLHYYLSPLDIRILKTAFGDFSSFPTTVLPRVERVSTGHIVDDELRRRAKYLAHLPRGCEVRFLECDWTDVVGSDVLDGFSAEIERRRKKNREKDVREEKERIRAEKEEDDKRWAAVRRRRPTIDRDPDIDRDFQPLPAIDDRPESSLIGMETGSSPPWNMSRAQSGSVFASLASPSTSPEAPRTVWGTAAIMSTSPPLPAQATEVGSSENDGWLHDWEQALLQDDEDLIVQKLEASAIDAGSSIMTPPNTGGKRRKNKKIMLMTTTARRGA